MGGRESKYQQLDLESCMAATGETEGNKTWRDCQWVEWDKGSKAHVSECKTTGAAECWRDHELALPLSWQREPGVWKSLGVRLAGVGMREMAWSRSWRRTAASGAHMSSCQQLERLGSRDNCGIDQECVPSCWIYLAHICTHTQSHCWTPVLLSQRWGRAAGAVFVQLLCVSGCAAGLDVCVVHTCALCGCWLECAELSCCCSDLGPRSCGNLTELSHLVWLP